jgi:hypothetical protein
VLKIRFRTIAGPGKDNRLNNRAAIREQYKEGFLGQRAGSQENRGG